MPVFPKIEMSGFSTSIMVLQKLVGELDEHTKHYLAERQKRRGSFRLLNWSTAAAPGAAGKETILAGSRCRWIGPITTNLALVCAINYPARAGNGLAELY